MPTSPLPQCDLELVLFRVGSFHCAAETNRIQEINRSLDITEVRHAPLYIRGVLNLRGQLLTIIDTRVKFGIEAKPIAPQMRIIVVRNGDNSVGLLVDQVDDITMASPTDFATVPSNIDEIPGVFFRATYKTEANLVALIDLETLLGDK